MTLLSQDGQPFCTGSCTYIDHPSSSHRTKPKIYIQVKVEGLPVLSSVDTGGVYLLCDPELYDLLDLSSARPVGVDSLQTAYGPYDGNLYRLELELQADQGTGLSIEATAFFPEIADGETWPYPTAVLGYQGCLERLRIAVDPATMPGRFHFGGT